MKKVFTASILAAAVALSFGANAADVSISNTLDITNEASAAGTAVAAFATDITFYNRQELSAGDEVYISFPLGTVLPAAANIFVDKGNGVGSFSAPSVVGATTTVGPKIKLVVETGSPVLNNSKTIVKIDYTAVVGTPTVYTASVAPTFKPVTGSAVYSAKDGFSGAAKDTTGTNSVALTTTVAQETVAISTKFNGFIKRDLRGTFETSKGALVAEVAITRPTATVTAPITAETLVITGKGFDKVSSVQAGICTDGSTPVTVLTTGQPVLTCTGVGVTPLIPVAGVLTCSTVVGGVCGALSPDTVTFNTANLTAALATVSTGKSGKIAVAFTSDTTKTFPVGSLTVTRNVEYTKNTAATNPKYDYVKGADFGAFQLDASVVNVPYLPVGYGLTPNVEIANAGSTDAEIQLEAFDQNGVAYGPVTLTTKAGKKAVTKVSEGDIETAFGLAANAKKKLSVTFVLDADAADITLAPYYRENEK